MFSVIVRDCWLRSRGRRFETSRVTSAGISWLAVMSLGVFEFGACSPLSDLSVRSPHRFSPGLARLAEPGRRAASLSGLCHARFRAASLPRCHALCNRGGCCAMAAGRPLTRHHRHGSVHRQGMEANNGHVGGATPHSPRVVGAHYTAQVNHVRGYIQHVRRDGKRAGDGRDSPLSLAPAPESGQKHGRRAGVQLAAGRLKPQSRCGWIAVRPSTTPAEWGPRCSSGSSRWRR